MRAGPHLWLALLGGVVALTVFLAWRFPDALAAGGGGGRLVYLVALLALVSAGIMGMRRIRLGPALRNAAIWVAIGLVALLAYSFRDEFRFVTDRLTGELLPHAAQQTGARELQVRRGADGHFHLEARVDGVPVRFLVDTGASDVTISPTDARRLGLDPAGLAYTRFYATANGGVRGAPVRLAEVAVGPLRLTDVPATVNEAEMAGSLLGMGFLDRLRGYEVRGDTLVLRW
ncbi:MAG: TIGR02281 family clan AA aspartic protease [Hyphomicrobiales bacterium]|nr:TIGR02281 family clan AA aspartic protease [Hyphomicrobiales bacterium]MCP5373173.1 TIGR02281 family clan AA aspartic protease [Hyphomicrobiales bacterium]